MQVLTYDTTQFNFAPIVRDWFEADSLETLHTVQEYDLLTRKEDQSTRWHSIFYDKYRELDIFFEKYKLFLATHIKPLYNENIIYQKIPTFRIQLANNVAVGEYHKDRDYRDLEWAGRVRELNYFLPLTDTNKFNTVWMESAEDKGDYAPALINYGECLEWDGSNLTHGNVKNESDKTRVSVDFRVMPESRYSPSAKGSINTNTLFQLGEYYSTL